MSLVANEKIRTWQPFKEPFRATLLRTGAIALSLGAVLALCSGGITRWPAFTLLALWPAFGGHWVEIFFLNCLRPHLPVARAAQVGIRVGVWFIGGVILMLGMRATAMVLAGFRPIHWPAWWIGGITFIGIELAAHFVLQLRGQPSFYNGRG